MVQKEASMLYQVIEYIDGNIVNITKVWEDKLSDHITDLQDKGYTKGYTANEVYIAEQTYNKMKEHELVTKPNWFYKFNMNGKEKKEVGIIDDNEFFKMWGSQNTYGIYFNAAKEWAFFVTGEDLDDIIYEEVGPSQRQAKAKLDAFICRYHLDNIANNLSCDSEYYKNMLVDYLSKFGWEQFEDELSLLQKNPAVMIELIYFIIFNKFVTEENMYVTNGYNAKKISDETTLNVLESFNYLIYINENPGNAILSLNTHYKRK
jgi:hypothetical protein